MGVPLAAARADGRSTGAVPSRDGGVFGSLSLTATITVDFDDRVKGAVCSAGVQNER